MRVRVLYHDHCFDGAASAAFFTRFARDAFYPKAEFAYTGMAHKASQIFEDSLFDGDVNAIVDFKYSSNPKLTWWLADLVKWADIVDGAQYADARDAVELTTAATKLVLVIEGVKGSETVQRIIRWMTHRSLDEIIADPDIQRIYEPLRQRHLESIDIIRREAHDDGTVVFFDLSGYPIEGYSKFIPYYLYPESLYTVSVLISSFRTKVSVGSNPWARRPLEHNLAAICERFGGGGHPRVGAISFPKDAVEDARRAAREIVAELRT